MSGTPCAGTSILGLLPSVDPESPGTVILGRPLPSLKYPFGSLHDLTHGVLIQEEPLPNLDFHAQDFTTFKYDVLQGFCVMFTDYILASPSLKSGPEGVSI